MEDLFAEEPIDLDKMKFKFQKIADDLGLPLGPMEKMFNSRPAQELRYWAEKKEAGRAFSMAAYTAYFGHGRNIAQTNVLADIAASTGLCRDTARSVLQVRAFKESVDKDWQRVEEEEIMMAPTLILDGHRLVGVHPYDKLCGFLKKYGVPLADHKTPKNARSHG